MSTDPFATPTVARIYAEQGKLEQAKALYKQLIADQPNNHALQRALAEIERKMELAPTTQLAHVDHVSVEQVESTRAGGQTLRCRWATTESGRERAALVLGSSDGVLTLRLVGFPQDPALGTRDMPLQGTAGSVSLPPPAGAGLVAASVGLVGSDGSFVSIAHCEMLELRPGEK